ncbi:hypothetical protein D9758_001945 [Tetrapyrgos nigripes]|uniref:mitogen-activated protein kinase kinase n=1 Tax=Tetrapyrgos nigripes TaxID=182062 RepID=A0A8H5GT51_9AGAR|nr:hypothetical protein D9758_001945 [Tetrapyrgos nigripes]
MESSRPSSTTRPNQRLTSLIGRPPVATAMPPSMKAKMAAIAQRNTSNVDSATSALQNASISSPSDHPALRPANSYPPPKLSSLRPPHASPSSGIAARRKPNLHLNDIHGASGGAAGAGLGAGRPIIDRRGPLAKAPIGSHFDSFSNVVDISGRLHFSGRAVLHASGVSFENGASFSINSGELELHEELGRGNYGTVKKVLHKPTNVLMAMKEIRLELDQARLNQIIMELEILHKASEKSEYIVEFHGAFFSESCVYYCMEYMDAGSLDKLVNFTLDDVVPVPGVDEEEMTWTGVPEEVLARTASSMVKGLKFLKDELEVIHRDVKPTNVLINTRGQVKLCDFGVSGQLEKSLAKTNIGCQSYMAPERIRSEHEGQSQPAYTVSSDVWSVGLSIIEIAIGRYPYPPEVYTNALAQLTAIVLDDPPRLPDDRYSEVACDWVAKCLIKSPSERAGYADLLAHDFIQADEGREVDMAGWVAKAMRFRDAKQAFGKASKVMSAPTAVE